jgi:hypothetical protein
VESLLITPGRQAKEPTRSLFAALLVLLLNQVVDASRFIVMAIALACEAPVWAALGGTAGARRPWPSAGSAQGPCWRHNPT